MALGSNYQKRKRTLPSSTSSMLKICISNMSRIFLLKILPIVIMSGLFFEFALFDKARNIIFFLNSTTLTHRQRVGRYFSLPRTPGSSLPQKVWSSVSYWILHSNSSSKCANLWESDSKFQQNFDISIIKNSTAFCKRRVLACSTIWP